ncbi:MAG: lipopolysaccharide heptosyltransferase I [Rhodocyclaceae bacterium]|nr:lipopolysaccharide heptosyltransferase I [Rhodocyclaceae bacterium]
MSSPKRLLLVKLSSLGDVIHNLPVVTDIHRALPSTIIDWATEAPYVALVGLHPAIRSVLPVHLRALKSRWYDPAVWNQFFDDKQKLAGRRYDLVIDTQGLTKSAIVANWADGEIAGYNRDSIREPFASRWYQRRYAISKEMHAVERNRALAAAALGYEPHGPCDYGLPTTWPLPTDQPAGPYVVCLHATSRVDKYWSADSWVELGKQLNSCGIHVVFPSGSTKEFAQSQYLTKQLAAATALPGKSFPQTAAVLSHAQAVVGVDTGLAHLSVALKRPTIGLYVSTQPALTGLYSGGGSVVNLGGGSREKPAMITVADVMQHLDVLSGGAPV